LGEPGPLLRPRPHRGGTRRRNDGFGGPGVARGARGAGAAVWRRAIGPAAVRPSLGAGVSSGGAGSGEPSSIAVDGQSWPGAGKPMKETVQTEPIGRVVATELKPSTPHQFHFWTARESAVGIGAIVRVTLG